MDHEPMEKPAFTLALGCCWMTLDDELVEAAGVEPASEIVVSQETPCSVRSVVSLPALRADKKRLKLVR
jgi:hypothetical protein